MLLEGRPYALLTPPHATSRLLTPRGRGVILASISATGTLPMQRAARPLCSFTNFPIKNNKTKLFSPILALKRNVKHPWTLPMKHGARPLPSFMHFSNEKTTFLLWLPILNWNPTKQKQHFRPRPPQDPQDRTKTAQDCPKIAPRPFRDRPKTTQDRQTFSKSNNRSQEPPTWRTIQTQTPKAQQQKTLYAKNMQLPIDRAPRLLCYYSIIAL